MPSSESVTAPSLLRLLAYVALPLYLLDQATKLWVHFYLAEHIEVIPGFFEIIYATNTGAAFGIGRNNNAFFIGLSAVAAVAMFFLNRARVFEGPALRWGLALLVSGMLGNLTDRIYHGHVIDFLDFHLGAAGPHWPAFNVADSCICGAVALFLWSSFRELRGSEAAKEGG